jgi:hypothetical protein
MREVGGGQWSVVGCFSSLKFTDKLVIPLLVAAAPRKIIMKNSRKKVSIALFAAAIAIIAVSVYCFWKVRIIREQLWERANNDPSAALLLMDKVDPEIMAIVPSELVSLNDSRSRNEKAGWVSMILAIILLISSLTLRIWRRGIGTSRLVGKK